MNEKAQDLVKKH